MATGDRPMSKAKPTCIVGYRRTSTDDQLLGIEAQDARLAAIAGERGVPIVRTFTEHESGGDCDRPELRHALEHARRVGAALCVAKLDRLARDAGFLMRLYDGAVPVIFGDLPEVDGSAASRLLIQMMASIAEFERRRIGERTREALAVLKARGVRLGTPANLTDAARLRGARASASARRRRASEESAGVRAIAERLAASGLSLRAIARELDALGEVTPRGKAWGPGQVRRLLRPPGGGGAGAGPGPGG